MLLDQAAHRMGDPDLAAIGLLSRSLGGSADATIRAIPDAETRPVLKVEGFE